MQAKYPGKCVCGEKFGQGDEVTFVRGKGVTACPKCKPASAEDSAPSMTLNVRVDKVVWSLPDGSRSIWKVRAAGTLPPDAPEGARGTFSVKGPLGLDGRRGAVMTVVGRWGHDPQWGLEFRAMGQATLSIDADEGALVTFLAGLPNVGPVRAQEIIRHFGGRDATLAVLDNTPDRLVEVTGITPDRAEEITEAYRAKANVRQFLMFCAALGIKDNVAEQALRMWGANAEETIRDDPFSLMALDRVGFATADRVAKGLLVESRDPRRVAAAVLAILEGIERDGHCWTDREALTGTSDEGVNRLRKDMGLTPDDVDAGIETLQKARVVKRRRGEVMLPPRVTIDGDRVYLSKIEHAERQVALNLARLLSTGMSSA